MSIDKECVKICSGSIVCNEKTYLYGDITIGHKTVVHPTASIIAKHGPIIIGDYNLIEENVIIINNLMTPLIIGSHNVFEVGSYSESPLIGDNNVFESKCRIGNLTRVSSGCIIGVMCTVNCDEILEENTIIFGNDCKRRIQSEKPSLQTYQLDFLSKILPNYQRIEKVNYRPSNSPLTNVQVNSRPSSAVSSPQ